MRRLLGTMLALLLVASCGSSANDSGDIEGRPLLSEISRGVEALESRVGSGLEYFEISADLTGVTLILAEHEITSTGEEVATYATPYRWSDGVLSETGDSQTAEGETFFASEIDFDPNRIFSNIDRELDAPVIVDFVIQGAGSGGVTYDVSIANDLGGGLLVLLRGDGEILGVQAS